MKEYKGFCSLSHDGNGWIGVFRQRSRLGKLILSFRYIDTHEEVYSVLVPTEFSESDFILQTIDFRRGMTNREGAIFNLTMIHSQPFIKICKGKVTRVDNLVERENEIIPFFSYDSYAISDNYYVIQARRYIPRMLLEIVGENYFNKIKIRNNEMVVIYRPTQQTVLHVDLRDTANYFLIAPDEQTVAVIFEYWHNSKRMNSAQIWDIDHG